MYLKGKKSETGCAHNSKMAADDNVWLWHDFRLTTRGYDDYYDDSYGPERVFCYKCNKAYMVIDDDDECLYCLSREADEYNEALYKALQDEEEELELPFPAKDHARKLKYRNKHLNLKRIERLKKHPTNGDTSPGWRVKTSSIEYPYPSKKKERHRRQTGRIQRGKREARFQIACFTGSLSKKAPNHIPVNGEYD